jgi:DNA helicase-2/ATP-dependent DNA helicase PcrA
MTRAKQELYLCHARVREFRGQTLYTVPSMFLEELPADAIQAIDLTSTHQPAYEWRTGGSAAAQGWADAGFAPRTSRPVETPRASSTPSADYAEGMLVRHDSYGQGRVTHVSGNGAMRKVKIRFPTAGERTFLVDKARLTIVQRN